MAISNADAIEFDWCWIFDEGGITVESYINGLENTHFRARPYHRALALTEDKANTMVINKKLLSSHLLKALYENP